MRLITHHACELKPRCHYFYDVSSCAQLQLVVTTGVLNNQCSDSFFGITVAQGWVYFHDNNDRWHLRLLVCVCHFSAWRRDY